MALLAFELFFRLLWGWLLFILFVSRLESSEKFLKISFRFTFAFGMLALLAGWVARCSHLEQGVIIGMLVASVLYLSGKSLLFRMLGSAAFLILPLFLCWSRGVTSTANFVLSAGVLGGAFVGQFLGHWYLNVPNIHIREFRRISNLAFSFLAARCLWVLAVVVISPSQIKSSFNFSAESEFFSLSGNIWLGLGWFGLILFIARVLWGLVTPAILTAMARKQSI